MNNIYTSIKSLLVVLLFAPVFTQAQLVINESFDGVAFPPYGWNSQKIAPSTDVENYCQRATASVNPTLSPNVPRTGAGMVQYRSSFMTVAGERTYLATRPLDMRAIPPGGATGSFWMWRDGHNTIADDMRLFINDSSSVAYSAGVPVSCTALSMQQVAPAQFSTVYPRSASLAPTGTPGAWHQYNFVIPQAGNAIANLSVVIVFTNQHTVAGTGNIYIDDFSVQTWPQQQSFTSTTSVLQATANIAAPSTDQLIYGATVTVVGGDTNATAALPGGAYRLDSITFNTIGCTNACTDLQTAKLWWTGGTNTFTGTANATQVGANITLLCGTNYTFIPVNSFRLHAGVNYFWVTYDIKSTATPGDCIDAEYVGCYLSGNGLGALPPSLKASVTGTLSGCRPIDVAYCGGVVPQYSVGTSWLGGSYTNNDYVQSVVLTGEPGYGNINNGLNSNGPPGFFGPGATPCPNCQFSSHGPDYEKFAPTVGKTTALIAGQTYTNALTLQVGTWTGSNYIAAWIDWNHDGDFIDAGEKIVQSLGLLANGTVTASITVPAGPYYGSTTLRVREVYATSNIDPCASYTFGEVEDYQITIIPPCTVYPGYDKIWLGSFDDDWNNTLNWCPSGVPTSTSKTIIPGSSPNRPVIKNGVLAVSNKIKIQGNDTLYINAYGTGSLVITDSLNIVGASACVKVITQFSDTLLYGAGTINGTGAPNHITFGAAARQRTQLLYTQSELLAQGMLANDVIDSIYLLIKAVTGVGANLTYSNFTISYYYTNVGFNSFVTPAYLAPVAIAGGTIYTNPSLTISAAGQLKLALSSPITWLGSANALVINICYDKVTTGTPAPTHIMAYTQTLGFKRYLQSYSLQPGVISACSFTPSLAAPTTGTAGANTITAGAFTRGILSNVVVGMSVTGTGLTTSTTVTSGVNGANTIGVASTAGIFVGMTIQAGPNTAPGAIVTAIAGTTLTLSLNNVANLLVGGAITFLPVITSIAGSTFTLCNNNVGTVSGSVTYAVPGMGSSDINCVTDKRPNLTFHYKRNYQVFPISVGGVWNNSGTWIAGKSTVTLNTSVNSKIEGTSFSTFRNLVLNKNSNANSVSVWKDVTVTDTLILTKGRLILNGDIAASHQVKLMSGTGLQGALSFVSGQGMLVSENVSPNYGTFRWNIGKPATYPQTYVIPLASATGVAIPFDYKLNADSSDISIATYPTVPANTPIPAGVSDIYENTWFAPPATDNSPNMVDRFWQVNETGNTTNRDFTFRWLAGENAASGTGLYRAQVYDPSTNWGWPFIIGQSNPTATSVTVPVVSYTNTWAIVKNDQPLPVELLSFRAKAHKDKVVVCDWSTASEKNNDYFTVERSLDGKSFEYVGKIKGSGTSNETHNYTFTDNNPYRGVSYYRLRQTDFDNRTQAFNVIAVDLSLPSTPVDVYPVPASNEVVFKVDGAVSLEKATLYVFDMTGRKILTQKVSDLKGAEANLFVLPLAGFQNGIYHFELRTEQQLLGNGKFICKK